MIIKTYIDQLKNVGKGNAIDAIWCTVRYGASPNNYINFNFANISSRERKTFLTHRDNKKLMRKYNNASKTFFFTNKYEFAKKFISFYGREFELNAELSFDKFRNALTDFSNEGGHKVIYKPLCGGQGRGILTWDVNDENIRSVYKQITELPLGLVEKWIDQDETMSKLYPDSVNPIRIQTLNDGKTVNIMGATITIGNGTKIANASAVRAIFGLVDTYTGKVFSNGYDYNGNEYINHPVSGMSIKGFQIPFWNEIIKMLISAANVVKEVGYIGWDVAITKTGPIIIEGNNDGGYTAYQLPNLTNTNIGSRYKYEKYL